MSSANILPPELAGMLSNADRELIDLAVAVVRAEMRRVSVRRWIDVAPVRRAHVTNMLFMATPRPQSTHPDMPRFLLREMLSTTYVYEEAPPTDDDSS